MQNYCWGTLTYSLKKKRSERQGEKEIYTHLNAIKFSCPVMSDSATPCTATPQASLSITNSQSLFRLMSIELVMPSKHLILCHRLLLLPSICPSIRVFSNESVLHIRWLKYWSFSFGFSPSNEYSRLIFFFFYFLTLQYCIGFAIYQHESATGIHVFPILNPPPSTLPIPSLWVIPVHQPSIVHWTWTGDSFHTW